MNEAVQVPLTAPEKACDVQNAQILHRTVFTMAAYGSLPLPRLLQLAMIKRAVSVLWLRLFCIGPFALLKILAGRNGIKMG